MACASNCAETHIGTNRNPPHNKIHKIFFNAFEYIGVHYKQLRQR